ncbi:4-hydroxyphenylacetate 3-hydroxylase family protein [Brevibacillus marinus]|uniref:4-hydroxyphenylacetate 3-hydroxylase family protein n=1 Tax=Brevibacillus marinus TaxID=2496837 RepID=UPI000F82F13D|nr:4-hydroxyphenylacetate 3-hydroxylase N-terminal domain-containing protein [Brevibacillus marinus]
MSKTHGERLADSLRDGRTVWLEGERVDVTRHPAFKGTLQTLRGLFDMLSREEARERVGFVSPRTGEYVHRAFLVPHSAEDLQSRREAFACWARETYGMMSRLSEYARSLVTGWYASRESFRRFDPHFPDKMSRYFESARDEDRIVTTAILDPQIDRRQTVGDSPDPEQFLRVVRRTEDGIVVRGAKMIATGAPYAHDVIVTPHQRLNGDDPVYAHMLIVPLNSPGLHMICRESFASPDPARHPLSARFEEMDAVLVFDDVLVPWERVFLLGQAEGVWFAHTHQPFNQLANHQTVVRLLAKLEFVTGVTVAVARTIGVDGFLHVQEKLGELITQVETIRGLLLAAEGNAEKNEAGVLVPAKVPLQTARNLGLHYYPRAMDILQQIAAGGLIQVPSTPVEQAGEIKPFLERYYRGVDVSAEDRVRLFWLAWDLVGSALGSRHELYERFYTGDPVRMYAWQYQQYDAEPIRARVREFLHQESAQQMAKEGETSVTFTGRVSFSP